MHIQQLRSTEVQRESTSEGTTGFPHDSFLALPPLGFARTSRFRTHSQLDFINLHVIYAHKRFLVRNKASFRWQSGKASQKSYRSLFHLMSAAGTLGRVCTSNELQVPACTALHATHTQPLPIVIVLSEGLSSASSAPVL